VRSGNRIQDEGLDVDFVNSLVERVNFLVFEASMTIGEEHIKYLGGLESSGIGGERHLEGVVWFVGGGLQVGGVNWLIKNDDLEDR